MRDEASFVAKRPYEIQHRLVIFKHGKIAANTRVIYFPCVLSYVT